jgi:hypothetical protein
MRPLADALKEGVRGGTRGSPTRKHAYFGDDPSLKQVNRGFAERL